MQPLRFYSPQWPYSTCFGRQSHPSSGVHMLYMATGKPAHLGCNKNLQPMWAGLPVAIYSICTPDDGWDCHPKHVE